MAFSKKKKYSKKRSFKKKSFSKKRKYSTKRRTTKKRAYVKSKRSRGGMSHLNAPRVAMNVIPRTADRLHVILDYKMRGQLSWANTAEQHIGMEIRPTYLCPWNVGFGPFSQAWPPSGANVLFPHSVSSTPGYFTLESRYNRYYVTSVSISVRVTRQDNADPCECIIGMMPLTQYQAVNMIARNTTLSPTANKSFLLPMNGLTPTTVLTGNLCDSQLMVLRQQPYVKYRGVSLSTNDKYTAYISQRYAMKKFTKMGYPYSADSSGILPIIGGTEGTPPVDSPAHYFFMQRTAAGTPGNEAYDIEFDLKVHATLHEPYFQQQSPAFTVESKDEKTESKEEKKEEEEDDLVDMSSLSLTSPKPSESSLQRAPTLILKTCLNSSHPSDPHKVVDTCV